MMDNKDYTGQLYAAPSFLDGLAGLVDLSGLDETYNTSDSTEEADKEAICSDWNAVGQDMRRSIELLKLDQNK